MDLYQQCASYSTGSANAFLGIVLQTVLVSQCGLNPDQFWPNDFGPSALKQKSKNS